MYHSMASDSPSFPIAQPYIGLVENTIHALRLVQAAQQGLIPRVMRRLNDSERREMITSGAVFIFGVKESGIKRWTDSMVWSPSRIVNNFLVSVVPQRPPIPRFWDSWSHSYGAGVQADV
jgi:Gti1/Pac2 family transcription factor